MTNLPPITNKQAEIVSLLYRHRYLSREHIQQLLGHKLKTRSVSWLKNLKEKGYVVRIYNEHDFVGKTRPATYYLGLNGVRHLRSLEACPDEELRKQCAESKPTPGKLVCSVVCPVVSLVDPAHQPVVPFQAIWAHHTAHGNTGLDSLFQRVLILAIVATETVIT